MRIIVPVSASDVSKLSMWEQAVLHYGGMSNHSVSFLPTNECRDAAIASAESLMQNGIQSEVLKMENLPYGGWPQASNIHFFEAARHAASSPAPWLWMELDCLPVRSGWADAIAGAYSSCGSQFMGCVSPTPWREQDGRIVKSPHGDADTMMCGVGVYPAGMATNKNIIPLLNDLVKGPDATPVAFDIHLRDVIKVSGVSNSPLIEDRWNTESYSVDEHGDLSCVGRKVHPSMKEGWEMRNRGGPIERSCAIIHGCKDESLFSLIMSGLDLSKPRPKLAAPVNTHPPTQSTDWPPTIPQDDKRVERLENELGEIKNLLTRALSAKVEDNGAKRSPDPDKKKPAFKISIKKGRGRPRKPQHV